MIRQWVTLCEEESDQRSTEVTDRNGEETGKKGWLEQGHRLIFRDASEGAHERNTAHASMTQNTAGRICEILVH